jgi:hypothetical protein
VWIASPKPGSHSRHTPRISHRLRLPLSAAWTCESGNSAQYARHASPVPKSASSSVRLLAYSSTMRGYYLGLAEVKRTPSSTDSHSRAPKRTTASDIL